VKEESLGSLIFAPEHIYSNALIFCQVTTYTYTCMQVSVLLLVSC